MDLCSTCSVSAALPEIVDFPEGSCVDPTRVEVLSINDDLLVCAAFAIPPPNVTIIFRSQIVVRYLSEVS